MSCVRACTFQIESAIFSVVVKDNVFRSFSSYSVNKNNACCVKTNIFLYVQIAYSQADLHVSTASGTVHDTDSTKFLHLN